MKSNANHIIIMIRVILFIPLILLSFTVPAQHGKRTATGNDSAYTERRYLIWASPSTTTDMYGMMFNLWPRDDIYHNETYPKIYGAEVNIMPLGIFFPFILAVNSIAPQTHRPPDKNADSVDFTSFKIINGIQAGLVNMEPSIINGLDISATGSFESKTNGVTISAVMNKHYVSNGLTIGLIGNHDSKCNGVQIGLINSCKDLKGFQLGLWNKNQQRSLPFVNWSFRKN